MAVLFVILRLLEREGEFKKILYKKEIQKSIGKQKRQIFWHGQSMIQVPKNMEDYFITISSKYK